jgi:hypothetical protein
MEMKRRACAAEDQLAELQRYLSPGDCFNTPLMGDILGDGMCDCCSSAAGLECKGGGGRIDPFQNLLAPALFDCSREKTRCISYVRRLGATEISGGVYKVGLKKKGGKGSVRLRSTN